MKTELTNGGPPGTKNLAATDMAREAGVVLVSLLPHDSLIPAFGWVIFRTVLEILRCCIEDVDDRTCRQTSDKMASH